MKDATKLSGQITVSARHARAIVRQARKCFVSTVQTSPIQVSKAKLLAALPQTGEVRLFLSGDTAWVTD